MAHLQKIGTLACAGRKRVEIWQTTENLFLYEVWDWTVHSKDLRDALGRDGDWNCLSVSGLYGTAAEAEADARLTVSGLKGGALA
jgi:hypothetical protein